MIATVQAVVHPKTISITMDTTMVIQEMKLTTRSYARYVAFRLHQIVPRGSLHSSVLTADVLLRKSRNTKTLMYTNAGASVVHIDSTPI
jgi:hypothetical protein